MRNYSQVKCKIFGEDKAEVKAVVDYIQERQIDPFFSPRFKTSKMINDFITSEYTIDEIDYFDPANYIELLELSKEHPNVIFDFIEQTKEYDYWYWEVSRGRVFKAPATIKYIYGDFDLVKRI